MRRLLCLVLLALPSLSVAEEVKRDIPYGDQPRQVLDVYSVKDAKNRPIVIWIHGGGWQAGDKKDVQIKPTWFVDQGYVFVAMNYRLLPTVDMGTLIRDVAKAVGWTCQHASEFGGDPHRLIIAGHSAGAQLAAILCTDERYLKAEGIALTDVKGCIPVDGDTYDIPAIIATAEARWQAHNLPKAKFGHREKFGNDLALHKDFSAVYHVAKGKPIPPFLLLHVADHPDVSAQAVRMAAVLSDAGIPVTRFGAKETNHGRINAELGKPDDPATKAVVQFLAGVMKK